MKRKATALVLPVLLYAGFATPAHAYLDGGSASIIVQSLIAGAATAMMFGRHQIMRIKGWIASLRKSGTADSE